MMAVRLKSGRADVQARYRANGLNRQIDCRPRAKKGFEIMRVLATIALSCLLAACADTHQIIRSDSSSTARLGIDDSVLIAIPQDGAYGGKAYRGSGQSAAQIVYSAFAKHTSHAKLARSVQNFDAALATSRQSGQKYLLYPTILHWEDRATEWSGISDKVEIKVEVVNSATGDTITSAIVKGASGLATFGGDHPQDLLPQPIEEFVSSLY